MERQAREPLFEVNLVHLAVFRIVQRRVGVCEDVIGGDAALAGKPIVVIAPFGSVVVVDLLDPPLGDVADPLAVGSVSIEGETLGVAGEVEVSQLVGSQCVEMPTVDTEIDNLIRLLQVCAKTLRSDFE